MAFDRLRGDTDKKIVVVDSSALMMLFEFSINLEKELTRLVGAFHLVVPSSVVRELEYLARNSRGQKKQKAAASLQLVKQFETVDTGALGGDASMVELVRQTHGIALTNDKEIRKNVKKLSCSVIFLRAKKKLVLE